MCPDRSAASVLISAIWPISGRTSGGTVVTVTGQQFQSTTDCKFGTLMTPGRTVLSSSVVLCTSAAQTAAYVYLELTVNNQNFTNHLTNYRFYGLYLLSFVVVELTLC
jgi:hypothetical protein